MYILNKYNIHLKNMVTEGDGANDLCMIKNAGIGVSFFSGNELFNVVADIKITKRSFESLYEYL